MVNPQIGRPLSRIVGAIGLFMGDCKGPATNVTLRLLLAVIHKHKHSAQISMTSRIESKLFDTFK
jgi:hypothetical protein